MLSLDDATVIDTVEARLIRVTSPPLNTAGVSNANTKRLKQLRRVLTTTTPTGTAVSTLAKGTGIGALVELRPARSARRIKQVACGAALARARRYRARAPAAVQPD